MADPDRKRLDRDLQFSKLAQMCSLRIKGEYSHAATVGILRIACCKINKGATWRRGIRSDYDSSITAQEIRSGQGLYHSVRNHIDKQKHPWTVPRCNHKFTVRSSRYIV